MKRILHIIHGLNLGGAENFIFNLLSGIDSKQFRFDFAIQEPEVRHKEFEKLIAERDGAILFMADFFKNPIAHIRDLNRVIGSGYDVVHIHMNAFINPMPAIIASRFPCRVIIHSHNSQNGRGGMMGKLLHRLNTKLFLKKDFIRLSCSELASKWMFGKKGSTMIYNAINVDKYAFNHSARLRIRSQHGITNELVIGQVGRLIELKNQQFSIRLLSELHKNKPELHAKLMLVGDGPDLKMLQTLATDLNVADSVIFTGPVNNVRDYYSAFDVFIMPSYFEGLAYAAVEAQAAGLECLISDGVTKQVNITDTVKFLPLKEQGRWLQDINSIDNSTFRPIISDRVKKSRFNLSGMVQTMEAIYS